MVVQVKPSAQCSKVTEGSLQKVEANILLLGAENVGKSGETLFNIHNHLYNDSSMQCKIAPEVAFSILWT